MNVSSKREGRRVAQGTFANGLKVVLAAVLTVVLVLQGSNLQAYADDLLGAQAPEEEVIVSDVVADDEAEGEKDDTVVTDEVETESGDEDVVTETESKTPPAAETEEAEEVEAPKVTTAPVESQLPSTTSTQPTNASTRAGGSYERLRLTSRRRSRVVLPDGSPGTNGEGMTALSSGSRKTAETRP